MIRLEPPLRAATPDDAPALAELVNFAGEGLPLYLWTKMAGTGASAWDIGCSRARREDGSFSYRNAIVAEVEGRVIASLVGYPLPAPPSRSTTIRCPRCSCRCKNSKTWLREPGT